MRRLGGSIGETVNDRTNRECEVASTQPGRLSSERENRKSVSTRLVRLGDPNHRKVGSWVGGP